MVDSGQVQVRRKLLKMTRANISTNILLEDILKKAQKNKKQYIPENIPDKLLPSMNSHRNNTMKSYMGSNRYDYQDKAINKL